MSAQGMFSIGGLASGLDTAGIIAQLMAIERQPIQRMATRQQELEAVDRAWLMVNTKLSSLRGSLDSIKSPAKFDALIAVSSSNSDAVGVGRAAVAGTGTLTFHVDQLARAHQLGSGTFTSATDELGKTGSLSVQVGADAAVSVDLVTTDSLDDVAAKLNDLDAGFTASVVKTADAEYRLVLDAATTGAASELTVTTDTGLAQFLAYDATTNPDGLRTLQAARDAKIRLGSGTDAIEITRPSNTIDDFVPGATITLKQVTTQTADDGTKIDGTPVTVTAERDVAAATSAVKTYVDALNGVIQALRDQTRYNAENGSSGALQGDPYARQLLNRLRTAVTAPSGVTGGEFTSAFQVGLSLDREGMVTLDQSKLEAAFEQDFQAAANLFSRNVSASDSRVQGLVATAETATGTYDVRMAAAATAARATGAIFGPDGPTQPKTFRISSEGRVATVTIDTSTMTSAEVVDAINQELADQQMVTITASQNGDDLVLEESRYGDAYAFKVEELEGGEPVATPTWFTATDYAGTDAAGEIFVDGAWQPMNGDGRSLSFDWGPTKGLAFTWDSTDVIDPLAPVELTVTVTQGLAGNVDQVLASAEGSVGIVARARDGIADHIDVYQSRIEAFEQRLVKRESTLVKQFTAMETALASLQSQGNWLAGQLSSLNGLRPPQQ